MSKLPKLLWTEGTIEAIALDGPDAVIRFRLVPSAAFLVETESGKRMLFKKDPPQQESAAKPTTLKAKLVACHKKEDGKEGLWFQWTACLPTTSGQSGVESCKVVFVSSFPPDLLLEAKNARCTLRLGVKGASLGTSPIGTWNSPIKVLSLLFV